MLGAGTMGGRIAQVAADKGIEVRMKDINNDALAPVLRHAERVFTISKMGLDIGGDGRTLKAFGQVIPRWRQEAARTY